MSALKVASRPAAVAAAPAEDAGRPHVVIIGAGFGGLAATRRLADLPVRVTLIDRHNYHLFTPLLYQVATAGLEPEEIAHPIRAILRGQQNVRFLVAEVRRVDFEQKSVGTDAGDIAYDYLVLAAGSTTGFFGLAGVEAAATGLKDVNEALELRNRILSCFEAAAWEAEPARRARLLTFVVVGGGPTGVEFSGALSELVTHVLPHDYPDLDFGAVRVLLIEAGDHLVGMFAPRLRRAALRQLREKGVEVRLGAAVDRVEGGQLFLKDGTAIDSATIMWAAGVRAGDLAQAVSAPHGSQGRISVSATLQLTAHPEVFVIGDMAGAEQSGKPLPMVAPVAQQAGRYAATSIGRLIAGEPLTPFRYHDRGVMATIGRKAAIAQVGPFKFSGLLAWLAWLALHIMTLIGFRNRLLVLVNWAYDYCFFDRAVRLILHSAASTEPAPSLSPEKPLPDGASENGM